jgi:hypothetical protein
MPPKHVAITSLLIFGSLNRFYFDFKLVQYFINNVNGPTITMIVVTPDNMLQLPPTILH